MGFDPEAILEEEQPAPELWQLATKTDDHTLNALKAVVAAEIERLSQERASLWYDVEGPELAESMDIAMIDLSDDGALRHRYAVAANSELHRSFGLLGRRQRTAIDRRRAEDKEAGSRGVDNESLREWVMSGGPKRVTEALAARRQSAERQPAPTPRPAFRNEPIPSQVSRGGDRSCAESPSVTIPSLEPESSVAQSPLDAAESPRREPNSRRPPVSGP